MTRVMVTNIPNCETKEYDTYGDGKLTHRVLRHTWPFVEMSPQQTAVGGRVFNGKHRNAVLAIVRNEDVYEMWMLQNRDCIARLFDYYKLHQPWTINPVLNVKLYTFTEEFALGDDERASQ